jgi:hypothetical protein
MGLFAINGPVIRYIFAFLKKKSKGCRYSRGYEATSVLFGQKTEVRFLLSKIQNLY